MVLGNFPSPCLDNVKLSYDAQHAEKDAEVQRATAEWALGLSNLIEQSIPFFKATLRGHTGGVNSAVSVPTVNGWSPRA